MNNNQPKFLTFLKKHKYLIILGIPVIAALLILSIYDNYLEKIFQAAVEEADTNKKYATLR